MTANKKEGSEQEDLKPGVELLQILWRSVVQQVCIKRGRDL